MDSYHVTRFCWNWIPAAYFERSVDSIFEVIRRPEFEWQLRGHLDNSYKNDDPAWYAIRNVVYASGCRLHHSSHHAATFSDIQEEAEGYFSNALLVHSQLLLGRPSLQAIRALLAMVGGSFLFRRWSEFNKPRLCSPRDLVILHLDLA